MRRLLLLCILAGFWPSARLLAAKASVPEGPDVAQPHSQLVVTPLSFFAEVPVGEDAVHQLFVGKEDVFRRNVIPAHLQGTQEAGDRAD